MSKELAALRVQLLSQKEQAAATEDAAKREVAQLKRDSEAALLVSKVFMTIHCSNRKTAQEKEATEAHRSAAAITALEVESVVRSFVNSQEAMKTIAAEHRAEVEGLQLRLVRHHFPV